MRISGGNARGIPLRITRQSVLRPATESNRERLFSSLGEKTRGKRVLDLFAGSGSYGLEALSRGAAYAHFVESNRKIFRDLKVNFEMVRKSAGLEDRQAGFANRGVLEFLRQRQQCYDLVFLDPPYGDFSEVGAKVFELLIANDFVHPESLVLHEAPAEECSQFENWELEKSLGKAKKGSPHYRFFTPRSQALHLPKTDWPEAPKRQ